MDNDKLLYTAGAIILVVIAFPFVYPLFVDTSGQHAAQDKQNMERISNAINNYATINQQYPASLQQLVPEYLAEVPLTSANLQFQYDPSTGQLTNPSLASADGAEQAGGSRSGGGGGISPATDAMTGLSVSEELNF